MTKGIMKKRLKKKKKNLQKLITNFKLFHQKKIRISKRNPDEKFRSLIESKAVQGGEGKKRRERGAKD